MGRIGLLYLIMLQRSGSVTRVAFILIGVTCLLLGIHGYEYGIGDMTETLSYALYLNDNSLFDRDLYIQSMASTLYNERYPFASLLQSAGIDNMAWVSQIGHLLSTLFLAGALYGICRMYCSDQLSFFILVLLLMVVLYGIHLGGNELWYSHFSPSLVAKSLGTWAILLWLRRGITPAMMILIPATFIQPMVGAQLAALLTAASLWSALARGQGSILLPVKCLLIYAVATGWWLMLLWQGTSLPACQQDLAWADLIEARMGHHFFPSHFPSSSWIVLLPCIIWAAWWWHRHDRRLFRIYVIAAIVLCLYTAGVEIWRCTTVLKMQAFKLTIWLELLATVAMVQAMSHRLTILRWPMPAWLVLCIGVSVLCLRQLSLLGNRVPMALPGTPTINEELIFAHHISEILPADALLVVDPTMTAVRHTTQRSLYLDLKSQAHNCQYTSVAATRRTQIYGSHIESLRKGGNLWLLSQQHFCALSDVTWQYLHSEGVTHIIARGCDLPAGRLSYQFRDYRLYELGDTK